MFTHFALSIALSCLSFQKNVHAFLENFFHTYLLDVLNSFSASPTFLTQDEEMYEQMRTSFTKININSMLVEDNDGENASIIQKYYILKKKFTQIHGYINFICNLCEKTKNLFTWKNPVISTYLICSLFLLCSLINALPIRLFLLGVGNITIFRGGDRK